MSGAALMVPGIEIPVKHTLFNNILQEEGFPLLLNRTIVAIATANNPLPFAVGYCCVNNFNEMIASGVFLFFVSHLERKSDRGYPRVY